MKSIILSIGVATLLMVGCKPKLDKDHSLPGPTAADFESTTYLDASDPDVDNFLIFKNTTGFVSSWNFGGQKTSKLLNDTVFFAYDTTYNVSLISASKGGISTVTKTVKIKRTSTYAAQFDLVKIDANHVKVTKTTPAAGTQLFTASTGDTSSSATAEFYFPWAGTYEIALTFSFKKGNSTFSSTKKRSVTIDQDDLTNPNITDSVFVKLTGGLDKANGRTWTIQNFNGVGGKDNSKYDGTAEVGYYKNTGGIKGAEWTGGSLLNDFTFKMKGYQFIPKNQKATVHYDAANELFGKSQKQYADIALDDPNMKQGPFILKRDEAIPTPYKYGLRIIGGGYLGYHENRYYYEIVWFRNGKGTDPDSLYIRQPYNDLTGQDPKKDANARYFTFTSPKL